MWAPQRHLHMPAARSCHHGHTAPLLCAYPGHARRRHRWLHTSCPRASPPGHASSISDGSSDKSSSADAAAIPPAPPPALRALQLPGSLPMDGDIAAIAVPMLVALAVDPIAGLVDTAFIGRLGATQLAGYGVALNIFNTVSKFVNVPLVSATTTATARAVGAAAAATAAANKQHHHQAQQPAPAAADAQASGSGPTSGDAAPKGAGTLASASAPQQAPQYEAGLNTSAAGDVEQPLQPAAGQGTAGAAAEGTGQQAEAEAGSREGHTVPEPQRSLPGAVSSAASAALAMAASVGVLQTAVMLAFGAGALELWGLSAAAGSAHAEGLAFLQLKALGMPFNVITLTLQGVFRGLQDTRTPLVASLAATAINVLLALLLIFTAGLGIRGAAAAQVLAVVLPMVFLLQQLASRMRISVAGGGALRELVALLKPSGLLLLRTASVTAVYAYATSTMARQGTAYAAAHQVAMTLWLTTCLLADALAVAAQSLLARHAASGDVRAARLVAERCLALGLGLGGLAALLLAALSSHIPGAFTSDPHVLTVLQGLMPIMVLTQPINMAAFVLDGVLFGAGGFKFASVAMAASALPALLLCGAGALAATPGAAMLWVWAGLTALMLGRMATILVPFGWMVGPFRVLRDKKQPAV